MGSRFSLVFVAAFLLVVMALFFMANPSYRKSIEAKYYYEIGEYEEAYTLANEAFSEDVYNRMASTIMAQSKTSLKYVKYINEAKKYMQEINKIAQKESIDDGDRVRIKMMSAIMTESYPKLAPSIITDKELVDEAARYHQQFEKLLEKVSR